MYEMWQEDFRLKKPFRVIIPVVFYHGTNKWNIPERFLDNFHVSGDLKSYLLDFSYILFDTNRWNPDIEDLSNQNIYLMCSLTTSKVTGTLSFSINLNKEYIVKALHRITVIDKIFLNFKW